LLVVCGCSTDVFDSGDASTDGPVTDGTTKDVDGIPDAGGGDATGDGGIQPFTCTPMQTNTILCDDFESESVPGKPFTSADLYGGGALAFDTSSYVTPTHSVEFSVPTIDTALAFADLLSEGTNVTTNGISLHASLRVHQIDATQPVPLMRLTYTAATEVGHVDFDVVAKAGSLSLDVFAPGDGGPLQTAAMFALAPYTIDKWITVRIDVMTAPQVSVAAYVDDAQVLSSKQVVVPAPTSGDTIRDAYIGVIFLQSSSVETIVDFDDFLFRGI
jgi:hypothetical protein